MNREPVHPDDPRLTDYALGEMTSSERAEFEAQLELSPTAAFELDSMQDVMTALSKGLKEEWCSEMNEPALEVVAQAQEADKVVAGQFGMKRRAAYAAAAAVAVLFVTGGAFLSQKSLNVPAVVAGVEQSSLEGKVSFSAGDLDEVVARTGSVEELIDEVVNSSSSSVHVPTLTLDMASIETEGSDLAEALANLDAASHIDASYLEAAEEVQHEEPAMRVVSARKGERPALSDSRLDSYLPPFESPTVEVGATPVSLVSRYASSEDKRAFVRGYVSMDGRGIPAQRDGQFLAGFRPVTMIGNPVVDRESDLRVISEFQAIQRELVRVVSDLPNGSDSRANLEALIERNEDALKALKEEFSY